MRCPPTFEIDCSEIFRKSHRIDITDLEGDDGIDEVKEFNNILNELEKTSSLVFLTNLRGTLFTEPVYPIILRNMRLVWQWQLPPAGGEWRPIGVLYMQDNANQKMNLTETYEKSSTRSKLWSKKSRLTNVLDIPGYCTNSRPWNIYISIILFPQFRPHHIVDTTFLIDHDGYAHRHNYNIFPSTIPFVTIVVVHPSNQDDTKGLTNFIALIIRENSKENQRMIHHIVYVAFSSFVSSYITRKKTSIHNINLVRMCQRHSENYLIFTTTNGTWKAVGNLPRLINISKISALCHTNIKLNHIFFFYKKSLTRKEKIFMSVLEKLDICRGPDQNALSTPLSQLLRFADGYAHILLSILGNFSYYESRGEICYNGETFLAQPNLDQKMFQVELAITSTLTKSDSTALLYPAIVRSTRSDMRFLTCSYKGVEKLSFVELLDVFDKRVWLELGISMVALTFVLHKIPSLSQAPTATETTLILVKLLLEQSNPFPEFCINNHRGKSIAGTLLLVGIVLSNAYKCTNVYNMIIPRKPVPYKYLLKLANNRFAIFTRSVEAIYMKFNRKTSEKYTSFQMLDSRKHFHQFVLPLEINGKITLGAMSYKSEVGHLLEKAKDAKMLRPNDDLHLLHNVSSMISFPQTFLKDVKQPKQNVARDALAELYIKAFHEVEINFLFQLLEKQKKFAVILPSYLALERLKTLHDHAARPKVYMGLGYYYEDNIAFEMKGLVPQYVIRRAKSAARTGLWRRWQSLFMDTKFEKNGVLREPLKRPGMDGNIMVVFSVLLGGFAISALCYFAEHLYPKFALLIHRKIVSRST